MIQLYNSLGKKIGQYKEVVGISASEVFFNSYELQDAGANLMKVLANETLLDRAVIEENYYKSIEHTLYHNIQEMKFYSDVNVMDSRRFITTSSNCISTVHILVRGMIYLNVYFRSSDFDNALPCDLEFLSTIPFNFIKFLSDFQGQDGFEEISETTIKMLENMPVTVNIIFGSLHRTNDQ